MELREEQSRLAKLVSYRSAESNTTPLSLAQEMVSKIPQEIIENKDSRYLDPCAGTGTFLASLYERLVDHHGIRSSTHILENQLHAHELTATNVKILKKIGFKNIEKRDFLNTETDMKFDVVIGNPPFNDETTVQGNQRRKTKAIYVDFIREALRLATKHVLMIAPSRGWIVGTHRNKNMLEFTSDGLRSIYNVDKHFNIKIKDVCYFWFDKNYQPNILEYDETKPKHDIPDNNLSKYFDTATSEKRGVLESMESDTGHVVHLTTAKSILVADSTVVKDTVNYKKWRVIFNMNGSKTSIGKVMVAKPGEYTSYSVSSLSFDTEEQAIRIAEYLESDRVKEIMRDSKISATNTKYHFSFIPDLL